MNFQKKNNQKMLDDLTVITIGFDKVSIYNIPYEFYSLHVKYELLINRKKNKDGVNNNEFII